MIICNMKERLPITLVRSANEANNIAIEQQVTAANFQTTCYYKRIDGSWKPRKELKDLKIGERLFATRLLDRSV